MTLIRPIAAPAKITMFDLEFMFRDLRRRFAANNLDPRGMHSCDIGPALGVPFQGRAHDALDDARSLAGMEVLAGRGAILAA